ncbi:sarcosine oxidase subunit gamma [Streptomyces tsukubensis]|uniref:Sarcosine oxidase subunit gamma n=1 Tax=Streptomyces tsukubensis TaxID=83656 RepID=A0A1V4A133_9ACTN|nr:sarcosine oxidase subunit gamma family protein [Streptomyces tsukubensis]OON72770.1 hypothetical protein B1H18_28690 [Streptomyces tsukubensis]QFR96827.1 sarcosine oxidase subunit gamma [Streptomyces tsukubensis]
MTVEPLTRRSPLAGFAQGFATLPDGLALREAPFLTQLTVRTEPQGAAAGRVAASLGVAWPTTPCTFTAGEAADVLWLGPDEWLVVAAPGEADHLTGALRAALGDGGGSVTDVSAQRTALDLSGPLTRDVLAHGCAVDLHPRINPEGTCVQTMLAQAGVVLLVRDSTATAVRLLVRSSFAAYVASWLLDASEEYSSAPH